MIMCKGFFQSDQAYRNNVTNLWGFNPSFRSDLNGLGRATQMMAETSLDRVILWTMRFVFFFSSLLFFLLVPFFVVGSLHWDFQLKTKTLHGLR